MNRLTAAQKKGRRMRAQGRDYRGGFTRGEIRSGEHKKRTCRTRGCNRRQPEQYCSDHRDDSGGEEDD